MAIGRHGTIQHGIPANGAAPRLGFGTIGRDGTIQHGMPANGAAPAARMVTRNEELAAQMIIWTGTT